MALWLYGSGWWQCTLDESAFSVSPYAPAYGQLLSSFGKTQDADIGNIWNQLSLIDTRNCHLFSLMSLFWKLPKLLRSS